MEWLLVGFGGVVGAISRYFVYLFFRQEESPKGTLLVNSLGSFLIGIIVFIGLDSSLALFFGVGVAGSFTTFSSMSVETIRIQEEKGWWPAFTNGFLNLILSAAAFLTAYLITQTLI
ncbi:Integral membrane protein implicated in fluoride export and chromosome condensation [Methanonatronarchaeum thermophilum]|uniref:Fluoride-specific ion channel FluC n=1 Tax=Methanonatronarchaeum thermophilum TaxID=1927129 RepID=A0A1Y3GJ56_9EURY|nr:CrcB family protein [Methanonatronarchaeum thermophilum]OUJ19475.1 Integral membrane protein implicated in fluoride export and chromosome condensation [Methanonatronarchaeum thermophilum]